MTSAGQVGVDLDADHAVMDLVKLGSMVQRSVEDLAPRTLRHVDQETLGRCSVSRVTIRRLDGAMVESCALVSADLVRPSVEVYLR